MYVLKFGGTSMGDERNWRRVLDIVARYDRPVVIVSATARTTRRLLEAAEKALQNLPEARKTAAQIQERHLSLVEKFMSRHPGVPSSVTEECKLWIAKKITRLENYFSIIHTDGRLDESLKDAVAATGEQLSSYLFARCASVYGMSAKWVDAANIIRTDSDFGRAAPDEAFIRRQAALLSEETEAGNTLIMGGYYGSDKKGRITTLGFEGSDYTASLMGAAMGAEAIEIWTDVSGIYTCDPRVVEGALPVPALSFQEAAELAYFGAKVLHPSTTKPAARERIPIYVKNIFDPGHPGTCITYAKKDNGRAKAMTFKRNCSILTVTSANTVMGYEFLSDVFQCLQEQHLPVDVVTTTEASVSITLENNPHLREVTGQLQRQGTVRLKEEQAVISLTGCKTEEIHSLIRDTLSAVKSEDINLISFSRSKYNLNMVVDDHTVLKAVKEIHKRVFE